MFESVFTAELLYGSDNLFQQHNGIYLHLHYGYVDLSPCFHMKRSPSGWQYVTL